MGKESDGWKGRTWSHYGSHSMRMFYLLNALMFWITLFKKLLYHGDIRCSQLKWKFYSLTRIDGQVSKTEKTSKTEHIKGPTTTSNMGHCKKGQMSRTGHGSCHHESKRRSGNRRLKFCFYFSNDKTRRFLGSLQRFRNLTTLNLETSMRWIPH